MARFSLFPCARRRLGMFESGADGPRPMAPAKKRVLEVGSQVLVGGNPTPARVIRIEGRTCEIEYEDGSSAVVPLAVVESADTVIKTSTSSKTTKTTVSMAREEVEREAKPRGRPAKDAQAGGRRTSRSGSRGRQGKTAKSPPSPSKKSKSPARKGSPARTASPGGKAASPARGRGPTKGSPKARGRSPGKKSAASPGRSASPAKKASSPARGRSATRKGASPTRGRSPAKKTPKSPTKKEKVAPRKQSKSPARKVPVVAIPMLRNEPPTKDVGATEPDSAVKASGAAPDTVTPRPTGLRQRIPAASTAMPNSSVGQRGEAKFEGTATIFEKYGASPFSREPSGSLRVSARIAAMQASSEDEEVDAKREGEAKVEEAHSTWKAGRLLLDRVKGFGWSATLGALSCLVLAPAVLVGLYLLCGKDRCTVSVLPVLPKTLRAYLHWKIAVGYGLFLLVQALLQAVPVGRTAYGFPCKLFERHVAYRYRLNAWLNLLGTVALCTALTHYGFPATAPYRYSFQLLVTALAVSSGLSVLLFVKGHFAPKNHRNPLGNTGNVLHDFVVGRELAPRLGTTYDLSVLLFRTGLTSWVVLLGSMAWYEYLHTGSLNVNFALCVGCQLIYVFVVVLDEEYYLSSVFVTEDGLGYGKVVGCLAAMPFTAVLPAKFLLEHKQVLPLYCLPGIVLFFLTGLVLGHVALKRKYCFRRNWPDPSSRGQGMDYLTDKSSNRLLVSGVWGFVRHPNYLGDLLCGLSFALLCGFRHLLPFYPFLASAAFLAVRTVRVERRCHERYGELWRKYTERVKYRIVPYVF